MIRKLSVVFEVRMGPCPTISLQLGKGENLLQTAAIKNTRVPLSSAPRKRAFLPKEAGLQHLPLDPTFILLKLNPG